MYNCGSEEIFDLSLNLVKPKYIPILRGEVMKKPLYFKVVALVLLEAYKNKPDKIIAEIIQDLDLFNIRSLYFKNKVVNIQSFQYLNSAKLDKYIIFR